MSLVSDIPDARVWDELVAIQDPQLGGVVLVVGGCEAEADVVGVLAAAGHDVIWCDEVSETMAHATGAVGLDAVVMILDGATEATYEAMDQLRQRTVPHSPVVLYRDPPPGAVSEAVARGAHCALPLNAPPSMLCGVLSIEIARIRANRSAVARDRAAVTQGGTGGAPGEAVWSTRVRSACSDWELTPREREVLLLSLQGLSCRQTASRLGVGHETVRTHIKRIRQKSRSTIAQLRDRLGRAPAGLVTLTPPGTPPARR